MKVLLHICCANCAIYPIKSMKEGAVDFIVSIRGDIRQRSSAIDSGSYTGGFQGVDLKGNITTLGRGGSDTSAALLAGRLQSQRLEIWTDVPGLFSADPRLIPEARLLKEVDYAEALEMAASGGTIGVSPTPRTP